MEKGFCNVFQAIYSWQSKDSSVVIAHSLVCRRGLANSSPRFLSHASYGTGYWSDRFKRAKNTSLQPAREGQITNHQLAHANLGKKSV
eukprot:scaffold69_cov248-Pinguiococcus_pyrenoidosus.AAC.61